MKAGFAGMCVGLFLGAMIGTAMFGPLGGAVGIIAGAVTGFVVITKLSVLFVREAAMTPFWVNCPETHESLEVTLDPDEAAHAEFWNRDQHIATCTRFEGKPTCDEACRNQLDIK